MSRVGKAPITLASGITVTVDAANVVTVKGPKGELKQAVDRDLKVEIADGKVTVSRPTDQIRDVLRDDRIEKFRRRRQTHAGDVQQQLPRLL